MECWSSGCFGTGPSSHHTSFWDLLLPSIGHMFSPLDWQTKKVTTPVDTHQEMFFFWRWGSCFLLRMISIFAFEMSKTQIEGLETGIYPEPFLLIGSWVAWPAWRCRGVGSILGCWNLKLKSSKKWIHLASFALGSFEISILDAYLLFKWEKCIGEYLIGDF